MIVRKDDSLIFPVLISKSVPLDARDMDCGTWRDMIAAVMSQKKAVWSLDELYKNIEGHKKAANNPNWKAKVRQTLQMHPDLFQHRGYGQWSLAA